MCFCFYARNVFFHSFSVNLTEHQFREPCWEKGLELDLRRRIKTTLSFHRKDALAPAPGQPTLKQRSDYKHKPHIGPSFASDKN